MKSSIAGKWALVTGSTRGIGRQVALGLAGQGANVIVHGRSVEAAEETCALLKELPVQVEVVAGELSSIDGVESVIAQVKEKVGDIDILFNNAAISQEGQSILEQSRELWDEVFQVNVHAMIRLCQAFAPGMQKKKWGRIVNVSSGIADQPDLAAYSVSKAAVDKFTRDLSVALKDDGITVNYVDPGWIRTDMGGPDAWDDVSSVLPGMIVPVLLPDGGPTGKGYSAQDYKMLSDSYQG